MRLRLLRCSSYTGELLAKSYAILACQRGRAVTNIGGCLDIVDTASMQWIAKSRALRKIIIPHSLTYDVSEIHGVSL